MTDAAQDHRNKLNVDFRNTTTGLEAGQLYCLGGHVARKVCAKCDRHPGAVTAS